MEVFPHWTGLDIRARAFGCQCQSLQEKRLSRRNGGPIRGALLKPLNATVLGDHSSRGFRGGSSSNGLTRLPREMPVSWRAIRLTAVVFFPVCSMPNEIKRRREIDFCSQSLLLKRARDTTCFELLFFVCWQKGLLVIKRRKHKEKVLFYTIKRHLILLPIFKLT